MSGSIQVSTEFMREIVAESMLKSLTQEKRDELIRTAIVALTKKERNGYSAEHPSTLENAFNMAVSQVAHEMIRERFKMDEALRGQVKAVIDAAITKAFQVDAEKMADRISSAIGDALAKIGRD